MEFTFEMMLTLGILGFSIIGYASGKFPIDAVSITTLGLLFAIFQIFPVEGISYGNFIAGFANHGLLTVMALLVVAQGVYATGVLNTMVDNIIYFKKGKFLNSFLLVIILLIAAISSSIMNNTPMIVIFIPLIAIISEKMQFSSSKALLPLSYAGILGGMTTLVGSSTNIIGFGVAKDLGIETFNFFTITIPGLALAIPGLIYVIFLLPRILPNTLKNKPSFLNTDQKFIAQIDVSKDSILLGERFENGKNEKLKDMNILLLQRGEHAFSPYQSIPIEKNDIIIVQADRKTLEKALSIFGEQLHPNFSGSEENNGNDYQGEQILVEGLISPDSRMASKNLEESRFRQLSGCIALGIKRTSKVITERITDIVLESGDVLLVQGSKGDIENLKGNKDILLLDYTSSHLPRKKFARRSLIIFLLTIFTISTGIIPAVAAAMIGAAAMIASGALSSERAILSLDRHVFLTIVAMLALSHAILMTGLSQYGAEKILEITKNMEPYITLSILFIFISLTTNFITNNASAALFMPLGISISHSLNIDPIVSVVTIILASNCSFATPYGYQTNLLVMAPGNYKIVHFLIYGIPLTIIVWLAYTIFVPWYYGIY